MKTTVLFNAVIIDCTGADPRPGGWLVIEDDRIREVGSGPLGALPAQAGRIDCRGQTLLPGLIEGHMHVASVHASLVEQQRIFSPSYLVLKSLDVLKETLDQGFTTARDCGGIDAGYRRAQAEGLVPGPRLSVSGAVISQTGGHGDIRLPTEFAPPVQHPTGFVCVVADGVTEVRRAAREQLRRGADFVKVMASGGAASPSDELDTSQYTVEELQAAVFEAESAGTYVAAHCYSDRGIQQCCKAGIRTIEHCNLMTEASAQAMKDAGAYMVPTMATYYMTIELAAELGLPANFVRKMKQALDGAETSLAHAWTKGVRIGSGSDCLGIMQRYKGMELALQARVMGPMAALVAATRTNAEIIRRERDLGTIEAGKLADLVLVKGDPLKDMTLFQDYAGNLSLIVQGGSVHKNIL